MPKYFLAVLLFQFSPAMSQRLISGTVVDQTTKEPIAYVNIGIINTRVGTSSFEDGSFSIYLPIENLHDRLTFTSIGYKPQHLDIDSIHDDNIAVSLQQDITLLKEVTVLPQGKLIDVRLGSKLKQGPTGFHMSGEEGGGAVAMLVHIPATGVFIKKINLHIVDNKVGEFKLRCRILKVTEQNEPGEDLLTKSVVVSSSIPKGWIEFDLSAYDLHVTEKFFIVFEWILDKATIQLIREARAKALPWLKPGADIKNGKVMIYKDERGRTVKTNLTQQQLEQFKTLMQSSVFIGVKMSKKTEAVSFIKESSQAAWRKRKNGTEESDFEIAAYADCYYVSN